MSSATTPYRLLLTISAVLLAVAGILGWLMSGSFAGGPPSWVAVAGIAVVIAAAFLVALSGRKVMTLASELSGGDLNGSDHGGADGGGKSTIRGGDLSDAAGESGAETRSVFIRRVRGEVSRTSRYGHDLSLLALSVDQPGGEDSPIQESAASRVLGTIGAIVRNSTRVSDAYGHTAPNRLVVLLAETEINGARRVAEKLRRNVEVYPFDQSYSVTVSIGVAEYRSGDEGDTLLARVERACTAAAAAGGNRVETA